jgi:hypothetical protein
LPLRYCRMWALRKSGVRFRTITRADGTTERWRQPRLAPWEVPRHDPAEPHPTRGTGRRADGRRGSGGYTSSRGAWRRNALNGRTLTQYERFDRRRKVAESCRWRNAAILLKWCTHREAK